MRFLTVEDVATSLQVKPKTAWKYVKSGEIPASQIAGTWHISEPDLEAWVANQIKADGFQPMLLTTNEVSNQTESQDLALPLSTLPIRFADLFAGCGGLSLGLHDAGLTGVFAAENDAMAFDSLRFNLIEKKNVFELWPDGLEKAPLDVIDLATNPERIALLTQLDSEIDLLAGGPPCQGFSVAGARNGLDERNSLFESFLKIASILKPPYLLIENVEGMDRAFVSRPRENELSVAKQIEVYLKDDLGYHPFSDVIDAADYGVPQIRKRYFIFAIRSDLIAGKDPASLNLFERMKRLRRAFLEHKGLQVNRPVTVMEALGDIATEGSVVCADSPKFMAGTYNDHNSAYIRLMKAESTLNTPDSHRYPNHGPDVLSRYQKIQAELKHGRIKRDFLRNNGTAKHRVVYLAPNEPAPTLTTSPDDFLHFCLPRIVTVREMARLQSFPDWFEFKGRYTINGPRRKFDRARVSQAGNAVAPFLAQAIGYALKSIHAEITNHVRHLEESVRSD
jgi:DNA (cytosine-5)-methyltransferase 1